MDVGDTVTTLHTFAKSAWDFLVGAAALSVVTALVSTAVEEFYRPYAQRRLLEYWLKSELSSVPTLPDWWSGLRGSAPFSLAYFSLPPDQFCAQVIRRLQSHVDLDGRLGSPPASSTEADSQPDAWSLWGEKIESAVDELQSMLVRRAALRSYNVCIGTAGVVSIMLGLLAGPPLSNRDFAPIWHWAMLTIVFIIVGGFLGPILQALIARILRAR